MIGWLRSRHRVFDPRRKPPMKSLYTSCLVALLCLTDAFPQGPPLQHLSRAQLNSKAKAEDVPEISYTSVPNLLKLPSNLYLGEGIGVATNSKGHIFVYTRSGE